MSKLLCDNLRKLVVVVRGGRGAAAAAAGAAAAAAAAALAAPPPPRRRRRTRTRRRRGRAPRGGRRARAAPRFVVARAARSAAAAPRRRPPAGGTPRRASRPYRAPRRPPRAPRPIRGLRCPSSGAATSAAARFNVARRRSRGAWSRSAAPARSTNARSRRRGPHACTITERASSAARAASLMSQWALAGARRGGRLRFRFFVSGGGASSFGAIEMDAARAALIKGATASSMSSAPPAPKALLTVARALMVGASRHRVRWHSFREAVAKLRPWRRVIDAGSASMSEAISAGCFVAARTNRGRGSGAPSLRVRAAIIKASAAATGPKASSAASRAVRTPAAAAAKLSAGPRLQRTARQR